jgi:hypothetical protein
LEVISILAFRVVDLIELPQHAHEIRLPAHDQPDGTIESAPQSAEAEMLAVEHGLRCHQLLIEAFQGKRRGQNGMLDIEEPIIVGRQLARFSEPGLRPRVRGIDGEMNDLGDARGPFPHDAEASLIPTWVGDDIDGHTDA